MGKTAIMGPSSSPVKRNCEAEEAPQGATKKRRKRARRHPSIGEQWGAPVPEQQGAGEPTMVEEQRSQEEHEKAMGAATTQAPITSFLQRDPAPSPSTVDECGTETTTNKGFEDRQMDITNRNASGGTSEKSNTGRECESCKDCMRNVESTVNACVLKKDWCITHEVKCRKMTRTGKDWKKKKNGLFGWVYKKETYYRCMSSSIEDEQKVPISTTRSLLCTCQEAQIVGQEKLRNMGNPSSGLVGGDYSHRGASQINEKRLQDSSESFQNVKIGPNSG